MQAACARCWKGGCTQYPRYITGCHLADASILMLLYGKLRSFMTYNRRHSMAIELTTIAGRSFSARNELIELVAHRQELLADSASDASNSNPRAICSFRCLHDNSRRTGPNGCRSPGLGRLQTAAAVNLCGLHVQWML